MTKPIFSDNYTNLQRQFIGRMADIEAQDRDACANCGGEDCVCCEIYQDRQRWVAPDQFDAVNEDNWDFFDDPSIPDDDSDYQDDEEEAAFNDVNYCDIDESEATEPMNSSGVKTHIYPCDYGVCPYMHHPDDVVGGLFCYNNCGLGAG